MKTKVKICGVKTLEAVRVAAESGADLVGLVFYPPSPRFVSLDTAREISEYLSSLPDGPQPVGLFVNVKLTELEETARACKLAYLQLAGDESPEICRVATGIAPVIKSLRLKPLLTQEEAFADVTPFAELDKVTVLLDAYRAGFYGGTGAQNDWEIAKAIAKRWPVLLAGGLSPENVAEAVRAVSPWGVDVSSGVEKDGQPGVKDLEKIRLFIEQATKVS